jgi:hypothetical protein
LTMRGACCRPVFTCFLAAWPQSSKLIVRVRFPSPTLQVFRRLPLFHASLTYAAVLGDGNVDPTVVEEAVKP